MAQWFGPKTVGFGVSPRSWQGWLATAILVGLMIGSRFVRPEAFGLPVWSRPVFLGVVIAGFLALAYAKYEPD